MYCIQNHFFSPGFCPSSIPVTIFLMDFIHQGSQITIIPKDFVRHGSQVTIFHGKSREKLDFLPTPLVGNNFRRTWPKKKGPSAKNAFPEKNAASSPPFTQICQENPELNKSNRMNTVSPKHTYIDTYIHSRKKTGEKTCECLGAARTTHPLQTKGSGRDALGSL